MSRPQQRAVRLHGICYGPLWKHHVAAVSSNGTAVKSSSSSSTEISYGLSSSSAASNDRSKNLDFCVLYGNTLITYENFSAFRRGDYPTSEVYIIGASAWNAKPSQSSTTTSTASHHATSLGLSIASSFSSSTASFFGDTGPSPSFRIVTHAGTNIDCTAPCLEDRDIWLSSIHTGLEVSYAGYQTSLYTIANSHVEKKDPTENFVDAHPTTRSDTVNAKDWAFFNPPKTLYVPPKNEIFLHFIRTMTPPTPRLTNRSVVNSKHSATSDNNTSSDYSHVHPILLTTSPSSSLHELVYDMNTSSSISTKCCVSCGRYPPENAIRSSYTSPLLHYGIENKTILCYPCLVAQGVVRHVMTLVDMYAMDAQDRAAFIAARKLVLQFLRTTGTTMKSQDDEEERDHETCIREESTNNTDGNAQTSAAAQQHRMIDASLSTVTSDVQRESFSFQNICLPEALPKLLSLLKSDTFLNYRRQCYTLEQSCEHFERRLGADKLKCDERNVEDVHSCIAEFIESLNQQAAEAMSHVMSAKPTLHSSSSSSSLEAIIKTHYQQVTSDQKQMGIMKTEALRIAGDMGTAIKLLYEYALPHFHKHPRSNIQTSSSSSSLADMGGSTPSGAKNSSLEMLTSILDFFIDLCDEGEMASVAFYWPQICQIHMRMLPPMDIDSLARVELMEDFLITICTKYSVHLALELTWRCLADLEDSLGPNRSTASASCRRRKFAVLRFVSELESHIFDFDGGWGGGNVSLKGLLCPSDHQGTLIRISMGYLQLHRRFARHFLKRSTRFERLHLEATEDNVAQQEKCVDLARRKYLIARNAEYFSTQIFFTRRLGDIAEKLRFMDIKDRVATLKQEIDLLNTSGRLGGDPVNKIYDRGRLMNVLHIPTYECHVFRSKARTPVLLLTEMQPDDDGSIERRETEALDERKESGIENIDYPSNMVPKLCGETTIDPMDANPLLSSLVESEKLGSTTSTSPMESEKLGSATSTYSSHDTTSKDDNCASPRSDGVEHSPISRRRGLSVSSKAAFSQAQENVEDVETLVSKLIHGKLNHNIPQLSLDNNESENDCSQDYETCSDSARNTEHSVDVRKKIKDALCNQEQAVTDLTLSKTSETMIVSPSATEENAHFPVGMANTPRILDPELTSTSSAPSLHDNNMSSTVKLSRTSINNRSSRSFTFLGEGRRQVLTTIFLKGMKSTNDIARRVAPAARRAVQAIDSHRAVNLLLKDPSIVARNGRSLQADHDKNGSYEHSREYALSLALKASLEIEEESETSHFAPTVKDECMESLRLLLIRHRVAQGLLTLEGAAQALSASHNKQNGHFKTVHELASTNQQELRDLKTGVVGDAGELDARLSGCGPVGCAIASSILLWKDGTITDGELLELVQKDTQYSRLSLPGAENENKLIEDSVFWEKFAFGELWAQKKSRIQASSPFGTNPGWDLCGVIVKSNDDVRQEAFMMQLIELTKEIIDQAGLELWIQPYRILATGKTTGIIEMVRNAMSLDSLKKRPDFINGGLLGHFKRMSRVAADPEEALRISKRNFIRSLAAYSLITYLFNIKDRHNGNLLIDTAGHIIHIDFGFIFGIAPGGNFSLEQSVPFKITNEMIDVMDGIGSKLFSDFLMLFCCGFVALQAHAETFLTLVEITCTGSTFKCFEGKVHTEILDSLRNRFCLHLDKESTIAFAMDLIQQATTTFGTRQYDFFQYISNGIAP